jgi:hypothetical protein
VASSMWDSSSSVFLVFSLAYKRPFSFQTLCWGWATLCLAVGLPLLCLLPSHKELVNLREASQGGELIGTDTLLLNTEKEAAVTGEPADKRPVKRPVKGTEQLRVTLLPEASLPVNRPGSSSIGGRGAETGTEANTAAAMARQRSYTTGSVASKRDCKRENRRGSSKPERYPPSLHAPAPAPAPPPAPPSTPPPSAHGCFSSHFSHVSLRNSAIACMRRCI